MFPRWLSTMQPASGLAFPAVERPMHITAVIPHSPSTFSSRFQEVTMNVLRGGACWLALFGFVAFGASLTGCSKKTDPKKTDTKTTKTKTTKTKPGQDGKKTNGGNDSEKQAKDETKGETQVKGKGKTPIKAKDNTPIKAKDNTPDPLPKTKKESGSGTRGKLRGLKLGSGR